MADPSRPDAAAPRKSAASEACKLGGLDPRGGGGARNPGAASGSEHSDVLSTITPLLGPNTTAQRLEEIAAERKEIQAQKRKLTLAFRNEKRKQARLQAKSSRLTVVELLDVLRERQAKKTKKEESS